MLTIFLCDDDMEILSHYTKLLERLAKKNNVDVMILSFSSSERLLFHLSGSPNQADIIYLEILMDYKNGMDTGKKLRKLGCKSEIVYLTASENYVFEAYDISPVNYLVKAKTSMSKFEEVFLRAVHLAQKKKTDMFLCEANGVQKMIPIDEISYLEIQKRIVTLYYHGTETISFYSTLAQLEEQLLHKNFVRVHRSYIVNLTYIANWKQNNLGLKTGAKIPIGVTYAKQVRQALRDFVNCASVQD